MFQEKKFSDHELWLLIRQEDRHAFEILYRRYMQVLFAAIRKFVDDQPAAEDILQEVFLDIWEKRHSIDIQKKIFPYLYSITRFKVVDHLRKKQLSDKLVTAWNEVIEEPATPAQVLQEETGEELSMSLLAAEIEQFPDQLKRVYILSFEQGKSIREVADELLVSPFTVKNHLQKIRRRLRAATTVQIISLPLHLLILWRR